VNYLVAFFAAFSARFSLRDFAGAFLVSFSPLLFSFDMMRDPQFRVDKNGFARKTALQQPVASDGM
jgi:hypothetical protein